MYSGFLFKVISPVTKQSLKKKEITKEYESYEKRIKIEKLLPGSIYNLTMTVYDKVFKRNVITYVKAVETDRQGKL